MKILIICSKAFYPKIADIKEYLERQGHSISLPNSYNNPNAELESWKKGEISHSEFKSRMFRQSAEVIDKMDAVLTLNFDKNGQKNYIGGATFLELYEAFIKNKKIFLYNKIPDGILFDEIQGFSPVILDGNLEKIV
jgi:hypothetical protein